MVRPLFVDTDDYIGADGWEFPAAQSQSLAPIARNVDPYGSIADRSGGTYNLIPGRALSAQTRLKNLQYEYPAYGWTHNPESPPWVVSVPAHGKFINLNSYTDFGVQPSHLAIYPATQMQSDQGVFNQLRAKVMGIIGLNSSTGPGSSPQGSGPSDVLGSYDNISFNDYGIGGAVG